MPRQCSSDKNFCAINERKRSQKFPKLAECEQNLCLVISKITSF